MRPDNLTRTCEGCGEVSPDVDLSKIRGDQLCLCPPCSRKVAFGGMSPDEIPQTGVETLPDPELPEVPKELVDELPRTRRTDYRAVVIEGRRPSAQASERDVTPAAVSQNVSNARDQLRDLSQEAL